MLNECELLIKWNVHPELARRILLVQEEVKRQTGRELTIISGYRTCTEQQQLAREGRQAASCEESTHTVCPATGVDVQLGFLPTRTQKAILGATMVRLVGLRWGGGTPPGPDNVHGKEWNHFDLGPRPSTSGLFTP